MAHPILPGGTYSQRIMALTKKYKRARAEYDKAELFRRKRKRSKRTREADLSCDQPVSFIQPQLAFVTTRRNTSSHVFGEERFTMFEVFAEVEDANRHLRALAISDRGLISNGWAEKIGPYGEITLESRGQDMAYIKAPIIYEVVPKLLREKGYFDPLKKPLKKTYLVYVQNFALGTTTRWIEEVMIPNPEEAGLLRSQLVTRQHGLAHIELEFSKMETAKDMVERFHDKRFSKRRIEVWRPEDFPGEIPTDRMGFTGIPKTDAYQARIQRQAAEAEEGRTRDLILSTNLIFCGGR